jgi:hypothetical protein
MASSQLRTRPLMGDQGLITTDWFEAEDRSPRDCSKLLGVARAGDPWRELLKIWKPPGER